MCIFSPMPTTIFILQTFPGKEDQATEWLHSNLGLDSYCPKGVRYFKPRRQKSKDPIKVQRPIFSGYLFVYENGPILDWYKIAPCPYIYGYVANEDGAIPITEDRVDDLKRRVENGDYDQDIETFLRPCNFEVNEAVLICPGDVAMLGHVTEIGLKTVTVQTLAHGLARPFIVPIDHPVPAKMVIKSISR